MSTRELIRSATTFDPGRLRPGTATRITIGFAVPILMSHALGRPAWGVLASLGALYAGMASFNGTYRSRLRTMMGTTVMMTLVTWLAATVGQWPLVLPFVVGIVAFVLALYASKSTGANTIAIQGTGVMVVISGIPATAANPTGNALLVFAGGIFQTLLLASIRPLRPDQPERIGVAESYESLAKFVRQVREGEDVLLPDPRPFQDAWALLDSSGIEREPLTHVLKGAEALRAGLVPFARTYRKESLEDFSGWLEARLLDIGRAVREGSPLPFGHPPVDREEASAALILRILTELEEAPPPSAPAGRPVAGPWTGRIRTLLTLPESIALRSLTTQHALRYGLAVGVLVAIGHRTGLTHAYWLPLTVALVMRPDYATTLTRGLGRTLGTVIGVIVASAITAILHPPASVLGVLMVVSGWVACLLFLSGYAFFTVAITGYVVFSVAATGIPESAAGMERVIATVVGAALAIVINLLWPVWQSRNVREVLCDAIHSQIEFGREVERRLRGRGEQDLEALRRRARSLRMEAERVVNASAVEPSWGRAHSPESAEVVLAGIDENAAVLLALNAESRHAEDPTGLLRALREAIQTAERLEASLTPGKAGVPRYAP